MRWLTKKGVKNHGGLYKAFGAYQYATEIANDVLRWGDGSIPGVERMGNQNGRLQGASAGAHDQFSDVAPRLALFLAFHSKQGFVKFSEVFQYLKPSEASMNPVCGEE